MNAVNKKEATVNQLAQARRIISARQIQQLAKENHPIFLAIVRANENPQERMNRKDKRIHRRAAKLAAAHGLTESQKRMMNKETGPVKNIISVQERERQVLEGVPVDLRESLENSFRSTVTSFRRNCQRAYLQCGRYNIILMWSQAVNPLTDHHIG